MNSNFDFRHEKAALEREKIKFERQKMAIEIMLKRRELTSPNRSILKDFLSNPIALAVVGGFITIMSGILTTSYTALENQKSEALRASYARDSARDTLQADLIKKFVEGPSPIAVRSNLKFLVEAGLLPSYAAEIKAYLEENPDSAPQVNYLGGIIGPDDAVPTNSLPASDLLVTAGKSVGRLLIRDGNICTAFLVKPDMIATAKYCVADKQEMTFAIGAERITAHFVAGTSSEYHKLNYAILRLDTATSLPTLKISERTPAAGDHLAIIMFRSSSTQFINRSPTCAVMGVTPETFDHLCDTGSGSSGSPIVFADSGEVAGIHIGRTEKVGWATRIDIVASAINQN